MTPQTTSWLALGVAVALEIFWVMNLKRLGWERPLLSAFVLAAMGLTYWFLKLAVAHVPVGVAYPIWTGLGAVGAVAAGYILYNEVMGPWQIAGVCLILTGVAMLHAGTTAT